MTGGELDEIAAKSMGELSDEELGKVSGGTIYLTLIPVLTVTLVASKIYEDMRDK